MPRVAPFRGLRFDPAVAGPLDRLTAPPYDVISGPTREGLRARSRYNIVHLDLASDVPDPSRSGYERAADLLERWRRDGALAVDPEPSYYAYEIGFTLEGMSRVVRGILCALELEAPGGAVLPHEETMDGPVDDRLRLLRATRTHLSPIYGTVTGPSDALRDALGRTTANRPDANVVDEEGVEHRVWVMPGGTDVSGWLEDLPMLIADGHHRYATALSYRDERRREDGPGPWDRVLALVVDAATEPVSVLPYHRVQLTGPPPAPGRPVPGLAEALAEVDDTRLRYATISRNDGRVAYDIHDLDGEPPTVRVLHERVLDLIAPEGALAFTHDATDADRAVRDGAAVAAYLLPATTPDRVRAIVARGDRLPRKSTFFWPKPRTGMVMLPVG